MENIQQLTHMIKLTILKAEKCSYHSAAGLQIDVEEKCTAQHTLEMDITRRGSRRKYWQAKNFRQT